MRPWQGKLWNLSGPAKQKGLARPSLGCSYHWDPASIERDSYASSTHSLKCCLSVHTVRNVCTVPATPCFSPLSWALCVWALTFTMSLKGRTFLYLLRQHRAQGHGRAGIHTPPSQQLAEGWTRPSGLYPAQGRPDVVNAPRRADNLGLRSM